jgi:RNA-binding protein
VRFPPLAPSATGQVVADDPDITRPVAPQLTGAQRKFLRGRAHGLEPVVQVGHAGLTPGVIRSVDEALDAHELIKVRLHQPDDKRTAATELAEGSAAALCGLIGHTVILYRPNRDKPKIALA